MARGEAIFGPVTAERVLSFFAQARPAGETFPELTDREREVLSLIADGLSNQAISRRLAVSQKTVRNHVSTIFAKLHVAERSEAAARARAAGLGTSRKWEPSSG